MSGLAVRMRLTNHLRRAAHATSSTEQQGRGHKAKTDTNRYKSIVDARFAYCALNVQICLSLEVSIASKSFRTYGGDDGARTRDLCRDRRLKLKKSNDLRGRKRNEKD